MAGRRKQAGARLWLRKRDEQDSSTWMWYIIDGKNQLSLGLFWDPHDPDGTKADLLLSEYKVDKAKGPRTAAAPSNADEIPLDDILDHMEASNPEKAGATDAEIRNRTNLLFCISELRKYWSGKYLSDVTAQSSVEYRNIRTGVRWKNQTKESDSSKIRVTGTQSARRELEVLNSAIQRYAREKNLTAIRQAELPPKAQPRDEWLTYDEVARLLLACRGRRWDPEADDWIRDARGRLVIKDPYTRRRRAGIARFILLAAWTGTRHDSVLRLRWKKNDSAGYVSGDLRTLFRRGDREADTSKSRNPCRIPLSLQAHIRRWQENDDKRDLLNIVHQQNGTGYNAYIQITFKQIVKDAGLDPERITPHTLRHTCAHWMKNEGVPIWVAADYLSMTVETLENVYGSHTLDSHELVVDAFAHRKRQVSPDRRSNASAAPVTLRVPSDPGRSNGRGDRWTRDWRMSKRPNRRRTP